MFTVLTTIIIIITIFYCSYKSETTCEHCDVERDYCVHKEATDVAIASHQRYLSVCDVCSCVFVCVFAHMYTHIDIASEERSII